MKPDRDIDPPDQYNRRVKKVVLNPFEKIVEGVTDAYRAGAGLPPLETRVVAYALNRTVCPFCGESFALRSDHLNHECPGEEDTSDWPRDKKTDSKL